MYVVIAEDDFSRISGASVPLQQAFSLICCRAGLNYHFEQEQSGWMLVFTDAERPECSPEPMTSTYVRREAAQRDLMEQALARGLRGFAAVPYAAYRQQEERTKQLAAE